MTSIESLIFMDESEKDCLLDKVIKCNLEFDFIENISKFLKDLDEYSGVYFSKEDNRCINFYTDKIIENKKNRFNDFDARRKALSETMEAVYKAFLKTSPTYSVLNK